MIIKHLKRIPKINLTYLTYIDFVSAMKIKKSLGNPYLKYKHYFLCSFSRSGRTWLRFILSNYFNLKFNLGLKMDFNGLYTLIPSLVDKDRINEAYQLLYNHNGPLIITTHSQYNPFLFKYEKILFLTRSVYDTLVSLYFHNAKFHQRYEKSIKYFIREPNLGVMKWINYMNSWSPKLLQGHCIVITYEQLHNKSVESVEKVLSFLNISCDIAMIQDALELSSFKIMKEKSSIVDHNYDNNDDESKKIRKGEIGAYDKYLDNDDIQYIRQQCQINLSKKSKYFLVHNGIVL